MVIIIVEERYGCDFNGLAFCPQQVFVLYGIVTTALPCEEESTPGVWKYFSSIAQDPGVTTCPVLCNDSVWDTKLQVCQCLKWGLSNQWDGR